MSKRVRISNDSLNSYGTRVLTAGMDVRQYSRNPVLLYMHERGNVIGYVKDLKVENNEVTGELMFDEASELSKRCKKQYEFGSLKMVSAGLDILELSDSSDVVVMGQTSPTITKSRLYEVSLVDIGANDDAIVLKRDGKEITLGRGGDNSLPLLNNRKENDEMELKVIALQLGLPATADEGAVNAALCELTKAKAENAALKDEVCALKAGGIVLAVEQAIKEHRLGAEKKDQYVELGKKMGLDELQKVLADMPPRLKLGAVVGGASGGGASGAATYAKLSEVPADKLMALRKDQPEEYGRLYKAEYGVACEL